MNPLYGQNKVESIGGRFEVNFDRACAPFSVEVNLLFDIDFDEDDEDQRTVVYQYDGPENCDEDLIDDKCFTNNTTFTYQQPGIYTIIQQIERNTEDGGQIKDSIQIEVFETRIFDPKGFSCLGNQGVVYIEDDYYEAFIVRWNENVVDTLRSNNNVFESEPFDFGMPGDYEVEVQGYFEKGKVNCAIEILNFNIRNDLNPININRLDISENNINIDTEFEDNQYYRLEVRRDIFEDFESLAEPVDAESFPFTDNSFLWDENSYCFRLVTLDLCSGDEVAGETVCHISLSVTNQDQINLLDWVHTDAPNTSYRIVRDNEIIAENIQARRYEDTSDDLQCGLIYRYRVEAQLNENQENISNTFAEEVFSDTPSSPANNQEVRLERGRFIFSGEFEEGGFPLIGYIVEIEDTEGRRILTDTLSLEDSGNNFIYQDEVPTLSGDQEFCFRAFAINSCGIMSEAAAFECVEFRSDIFIPNAFTPNGDGLNDEFGPELLFRTEVEMEVYNRWGELVFKEKDIDVRWDGRFKGNYVPNGVYIYRISYRNEAGELIQERGKVSVIR